MLLVISLCSTTAEARCVKSYVCDDWGSNCHYQDICDSSIDLPSINLPPLPSVRNPGLKPLASVQLPPLGTSECEQKVVNGYWKNVCQ